MFLNKVKNIFNAIAANIFEDPTQRIPTKNAPAVSPPLVNCPRCGAELKSGILKIYGPNTSLLQTVFSSINFIESDGKRTEFLDESRAQLCSQCKTVMFRG